MYAICHVIYGKVLSREEQDMLDKHLEQTEGPEVDDWLREEKLGDGFYSGSGGCQPSFFGVVLSQFDEATGHGMAVSKIRTTPTEEEVKRVAEIQEKVKDLIEFEPQVQLCFSTS